MGFIFMLIICLLLIVRLAMVSRTRLARTEFCVGFLTFFRLFGRYCTVSLHGMGLCSIGTVICGSH